jgi:hypothetical protein
MVAVAFAKMRGQDDLMGPALFNAAASQERGGSGRGVPPRGAGEGFESVMER